MPKNLFQDMVKVKRERREEARQSLLSDRPEEPEREYTVPVNQVKSPVAAESPRNARDAREEFNHEFMEPIGGRRPRLWGVALISVVFFLFALSFLFTKAEVTVNPKIEDLILNENLSATKDASSDNLPFEVVIIPGQEERIVAGGELKDVSLSAKGTAIIYNSYSSATQRLDINTRLEGSNGKIYKTEKAIVVPGMKGDAPGSVEVAIYAAEAGAEYNSTPLDFKIFGFKGTSKYAKFYARSKGALSGGVKGKVPTISASQRITLEDELETALEAKLFKNATDQIPSGFILFKDAIILDTESANFESISESNNSKAIVKGTLYGVLFDEKKLTAKIAKDNIGNYDGSEVYIPNIGDLIFSLAPETNISDFANLRNINFNLSGPAKVVWKLDEAKLISDLTGRSKNDFNQILSQYPNIGSAESRLSPFWKRSFPDDSEEIEVIVNYPE